MVPPTVSFFLSPQRLSLSVPCAWRRLVSVELESGGSFATAIDVHIHRRIRRAVACRRLVVVVVVVVDANGGGGGGTAVCEYGLAPGIMRYSVFNLM